MIVFACALHENLRDRKPAVRLEGCRSCAQSRAISRDTGRRFPLRISAVMANGVS